MTHTGRQTPSQTAGPFFHIRLGGRGQNELVEREAPGAIRIEGRVLDGDQQPVRDALIEIWQADADGRYSHPADRWPASRDAFTGFGRATTDPHGAYLFETKKPGRVRAVSGVLQAPHVSLLILARGLLGHLYTRLYFEDEPQANAEDPVLSAVPHERRATLIAVHDRASHYRMDVVLRGPDETVFFDV